MEIKVIKKVFDSHGIDIITRNGEYGYEVYRNNDTTFFIRLDINSVVILSRALDVDVNTFIEEYYEAEVNTP
jgi:hypothetical protein